MKLYENIIRRLKMFLIAPGNFAMMEDIQLCVFE